MSQVGQSGDNVCDISRAASPDLTSPGISLLQQWPQVCKSELFIINYFVQNIDLVGVPCLTFLTTVQVTSQNVIYKLQFASNSTKTRAKVSSVQRGAASLSGSPRPHHLTSGTINQNIADEEKLSSFLLKLASLMLDGSSANVH